MIDRTVRVAPLGALALFVVAGAVQSHRPIDLAVVTASVAIAAGAVIVWHQLRGVPLLGLLAVVAVGLFVLCHPDPSNLGWFGMCVIAGWAALENGTRWAVLTGTALVGAFGVEWLIVSDEPGWGAWITGTIFTTMACTFARRQRELVTQLRDAQAALTDQARIEERNRIAGEMHDVIGHALTVSLLHVSGARLALDDDDPEEARVSLAEAERLAGASLQEVRAAVGFLRTDGSRSVSPLPTGTQLEELVDSYRRAGRAVEFDVRGDLSAVGAAKGLAVYRIVQESLTNAMRHGDGSAPKVMVEIDEEQTVVRVVNAGAVHAGAVEGSGVLGMRERAEAVGGRLQSGPSPHGWTVEARIPS